MSKKIEINNSMQNEEEEQEPDFYDQSSEEEDMSMVHNKNHGKAQNDSFKNDLIKVNNSMNNTNLNLNLNLKEQVSNFDMSMNNQIKENIKKKINNENKILEGIENESEEDEEDDGEPDFFKGVAEEEKNMENSDGQKKSEEEDDHIEEEENESSFDPDEEKKKKDKDDDDEEEGNNIDIDNIYEINKKFDYDRDLPIFYVKEKYEGDGYPWPVSTNKIKSMIQKDKVPYKDLKVKLVDLFEHKRKEAFTYFDFEDAMKKGWAENITESKIFKQLHRSMNEKEKEKKDEHRNRKNSFIESVDEKDIDNLSSNVKNKDKKNKSGIISGEELVNKLNPNNKVNKNENVMNKTDIIY